MIEGRSARKFIFEHPRVLRSEARLEEKNCRIKSPRVKGQVKGTIGLQRSREGKRGGVDEKKEFLSAISKGAEKVPKSRGRRRKARHQMKWEGPSEGDGQSLPGLPVDVN